MSGDDDIHFTSDAVGTRVMTDLTVAGLIRIIDSNGKWRAAAVIELGVRAQSNSRLLAKLGELARRPALLNDRLFHGISLAHVAIMDLLAENSPEARDLAYSAFHELAESDQGLLLAYLHVEDIHDASIPLPI